MRIGILTSGGDCPGLNACIRGLVIACQKEGWTPIGIQSGTFGLTSNPTRFQILKEEDVDCWRLGGTFLGSTNRYDTTVARENFLKNFINGCKELELDVLVGIGGDGSIKILRKLTQKARIPFIAIPKTIDNDISFTDMAIGHSTVVELATNALGYLESTAMSHQRVMVLEVMGRDAGHIALNSGIAGGADVILIKERPYKFSSICDHINNIFPKKKRALVVVSEALVKEDYTQCVQTHAYKQKRYGGVGHYIGKTIEQMLQIETRVTVLGHIQRGAPPNAADKMLALRFACYTIDMIKNRVFDHMVCLKNGRISHVPIFSVRTKFVLEDDPLVKIAKKLGIYVGEILPSIVSF